MCHSAGMYEIEKVFLIHAIAYACMHVIVACSAVGLCERQDGSIVKLEPLLLLE